MSPLILGLSLFFAGLVIYFLSAWLPRLVSNRRNMNASPVSPEPSGGISTHDHAVLVVTTGGRIQFANELARQWFGLEDSYTPNIEHLSRYFEPADAFLRLCTQPGEVQLSHRKTALAASSFYFPMDGETAYLLTFHKPAFNSLVAASDHASSEALDLYSSYSKRINASLDLKTTLGEIIDSIFDFLPADHVEISIWDEDKQQLIPHRTVASGGDKSVESISIGTSLKDGYSGFIASNKNQLLVPNRETFNKVQDVRDPNEYPYQSFLGHPLLVKEELIGTIELFARSADFFEQNHARILAVLADQAALSVRNASLFEAEKRRVVELAGLAELAQVSASIRDPKDLFALLVDGLAPALAVDVFGLLLYDDSRGLIEGQTPFRGMPSQFIQLYRSHIPSDSKAEKIWLSQKIIHAHKASNDPDLTALQLNHLAQAAGINETILIPLISGGRSIGYMQAANKSDGSSFSSQDVHLASILAGHAAPIIENALLIRDSRRRTQRNESIRRIASLVAFASDLDEILKFSLQEIAAFFQAQNAFILLLNQDTQDMEPHLPSFFGAGNEKAESIKIFSENSLGFKSSATFSQKVVLSATLDNDEDIPEIYNELLQPLGEFQSLAVIPLINRNQGIGEIVLISPFPDFFDSDEIFSMVEAASQLAAAVDRSRDVSQSDETLQKRVRYLTYISRINRELAASPDTRNLLKTLFSEVSTIANADGGSVAVITNDGDGMPNPSVDIYWGNRTGSDLTPLEISVIESGSPLIISDFELDEHSPSWSGAKSALLVPIRDQDGIVGLIHVHSSRVAAFDADLLDTLKGMSANVAAAIRNSIEMETFSRQMKWLSHRGEILQQLLDNAGGSTSVSLLEQSLKPVVDGILQFTSLDTAIIYTYDEESGSLQARAGAGFPISQLDQIRQRRIPWQMVETLLISDFFTGSIYHIPSEKMPEAALRLTPHVSPTSGGATTASLRLRELFLVPLFSPDGQPLGLLRTTSHSAAWRMDEKAVEQLLSIAFEAEDLISWSRDINLMSDGPREFRDQISRANSNNQETIENMTDLIQQDEDQTLAIHRLNERAGRIRMGLDIAELANQQPDRSSILYVLADQLLIQMGFDLVLVAEPSPGGSRLIHTLGTIPENTNPETLLGQRNPLSHSTQTGESLIISKLPDNAEWYESPLLKNLSAVGIITLPVISDGNVVASILAISHRPLPDLSDEDKQVFDMIANQVAIAIQNLDLLNETRLRLKEVNLLLDFSNQLGSLDQSHVLNTLIKSSLEVIRRGHAGFVVLPDPNGEGLHPTAAVGYTDNELINRITYHERKSSPWQVFETAQPLRLKNVDFAGQFQLPPDDLLIYRKATDGRLPASDMLVPIKISEKNHGLLVLENFNTPGAFTEEDEALVVSLAQQTALALENASLFHASTQRAKQLQALMDAAASISSSLDPDSLVSSLLENLARILPFDTGTLWMLKEDVLTLQAAIGFEDSDRRIGLTVDKKDSALLGEMISTGEPIRVPNILKDDRFPSRTDHPYKSWLGVPLISKGRVIGVVALEKSEIGYYTLEHIRAAKTFASQAAVALENAHLFEEARLFAQELEARVAERTAELLQEHQATRTLLSISTELSSSLDLDQVLNRSLELLNQTTGATHSSILLMRPAEPNLIYRAGVGVSEPPPYGGRPASLKPGEGMAGWVIDNRKPLVIPSLREDPRWRKGIDDDHSHKSAIAAPMIVGEDALGALMLFNEKENHFSESQLDMVQAAANQFAVGINNGELYRLIRDQAESLGSMLRSQQVETSRSTAMLKGVADGVLVTDAANTITLFNAAAETILELQSDRIVGQSLDEFVGLFGGAAETWMSTIKSWSEQPALTAESEAFSEQILLEDGRVVSISLAPVSSREEYLGTISVFRDITHQVEVDRLKSEFVATVSHELRTPMTPIKGYVEFLMMEGAGALTEKQKEFLGIIQSNINRLSDLVNDLLDVSRIEAGREAFDFQPVQMGEAVEEIVHASRAQAEEDGKTLAITTEVADGLPQAYADPDRIRRVIANLVENAYNYTPEDGHVTVRVHPVGEFVQVDVIDNGMGIFPDDQERIFERFYRGDNPMVMASAGTGLGLHIVRELVHIQGGEIWVESEGVPGKGSTFSFTVPVFQVEEQAVQTGAEA